MSDDMGDTFSCEAGPCFRSDDMGDTSCSVRPSAPDSAVEGKDATDTLVLEIAMMLRVENPERKFREVNAPSPVRERLESEQLALERGTDVPADSVVANVAVRVGAFDREVWWILGLRQPRWKLSARSLVELARRSLTNTFVRPFEVVLLSKLIEATLLTTEVRLGWRCSLSLQGSVHPFMPAVLIGATWENPFRHNTEA
jgi:hypothetical protein